MFETGAVMHGIIAELQVPGERDEVRSTSELEPMIADDLAHGIAADGGQRALAIVTEVDEITSLESRPISSSEARLSPVNSACPLLVVP